MNLMRGGFYFYLNLMEKRSRNSLRERNVVVRLEVVNRSQSRVLQVPVICYDYMHSSSVHAGVPAVGIIKNYAVFSQKSFIFQDAEYS